MKFLNGKYYVQKKDERYIFNPFEKIIQGLRDPPKSLKTQYRMQNETEIRQNQQVIRKHNDELIVKNYPKNKQPIIQQGKITLSSCPDCKRNNWLEFDKGYPCPNCQYNINKQKHQIDKIVLIQNDYSSTSLPYAEKRLDKRTFFG